jgi:hypothetical protein
MSFTFGTPAPFEGKQRQVRGRAGAEAGVTTIAQDDPR